MSEVYDMYLKACFRDNVGSAVSFHRKNGRGYSTNINEAHHYTKDEAQKEWDNYCRSFEMMIHLGFIMDNSERRFDMQYLDKDYSMSGARLPYIKGSYDGNDLVFKTPVGATSNASVAMDNLWAKSETKGVPFITTGQLIEHDRLAVRYSEIISHPRKIYTGLKMPVKVKNQRRRERRPTTGKSRLNCVECGKIFWDFDYNTEECDSCREKRMHAW